MALAAVHSKKVIMLIFFCLLLLSCGGVCWIIVLWCNYMPFLVLQSWLWIRECAGCFSTLCLCWGVALNVLCHFVMVARVCLMYWIVALFVSFDGSHPSQQLWSFRKWKCGISLSNSLILFIWTIIARLCYNPLCLNEGYIWPTRGKAIQWPFPSGS